MRILGAGVLVLFTSVSGFAQETQAPPPVFETRVNSVFIDTFVTEKDVPISGLLARDFVLKDNGTRQPFELIPTASLPTRTLLVFDTSDSVSGAKLERLQATAQSLLDHLRPEDEAGLISFSEEIALLSPLTTDHTKVRMALLRLKASGATSLYDALATALILPRSALRTLILVFSDGEDNNSWVTARQLRQLVERSNALLYVVAARSASFTSGLVRPGTRGEDSYTSRLRAIATITGGSLLEVTSADHIGPAFASIIEKMRSRYVLRYDPENEPAAGWHRLEVQLSGRRGDVTNRSGYWVEKP
ncbi:MAG: VWA domain-containing protein [Vicinamibacteria bacterium]